MWYYRQVMRLRFPVGFTGTREGMTPEQRVSMSKWLHWNRTRITAVHHGDCIGADAEFHALAKYLYNRWTVIHPPDKDTYRAFCKGDEYRLPAPYLVRNRAIVDEAELLLATPATFEEEIRSGTWTTIRYGRKRSKPVVVIKPDGEFDSQFPHTAIDLMQITTVKLCRLLEKDKPVSHLLPTA